LKISPEGNFDYTLALTCSGAPPAGTCTISPASLTPGPTASATATVTVTTTARSGVMRYRRPGFPGGRGTGRPQGSPLLLLVLLALTVAALYERRILVGERRPEASGLPYLAMGLLLAILGWVACGGGGGVTPPSGTPPGNYTLTVTATYTSGTTSLQHTLTLPLTVD